MPKVLENVIVGADAEPKTHGVRVMWANGASTVHQFGHLVGKGVFSAFADPEFFARITVGERGRSLDWPDGIDFCADALWFEAKPAEAPRSAEVTTGATVGQQM